MQEDKKKSTKLYDSIYALVRMIPSGKVATYGQIASILGKCSPRQVGYAMAATPANKEIPWQRVINSQGRVSPRTGGEGATVQRMILEKEGVKFNSSGTVDFKKVRWQVPDLDYSTEISSLKDLF